MAAPRLRLRRGIVDPQTLVGAGQTFGDNPALVGEPVFTDTNPTYIGLGPSVTASGTGDFYIADGGTSFVHIGGSSYTQRVDSFLVDQDPRDVPSTSAGAKIILEEGGPTPETITIQAPVQGNAANSYTMLLPVGAPTVPGQYLIEYDQATSQLSFVDQVASEQLLTQQVPEDIDATPDVYYPTFVANNVASPGQLETYYTEPQLTFLPDKDGNAAGTISSLNIVGEYVASTGYFSGTGSTDTASVTTNFATEPTASGNTKEVNVGTGSAANSTTNINIGSAVTGKTDFLGTDDNTLGTVASGAVQMDGGLGVVGNATVGGDLSVVGGDIVADPANLPSAVSLFDTSTGTANLFGAATTSNIAYDGTASSTTNIADGATASANTNTINIGTGGVTGSTTNVTIGSAFAGTTEFLGTDDNTPGNVTTGAVQMDGGLGVAKNVTIGAGLDVNSNITHRNGTILSNGTNNNTLGNLTTGTLRLSAGGAAVNGNVTIGGDLAVEGGDIVADPDNPGNTAALYDTSTGTVNIGGASATLNLGNDGTGATTVNIATGVTAAATTKTVNIATDGASGSTTAVNIGSASEPTQTTVTINGNLNVLGTQTTTNINTNNTNVQDALLALNSGMGTGAGALANNTNDVGLFIERGTAETNAFVGYDESENLFVTAYISSAKTAAGFVTFSSAIVTGDAAATPLDFLPIQIGQLRFSDSTSRRTDGLSAEGAQVDEVVIGHLTAANANTEFGVSDGVAGRHVYNVVIDGGVF